MSFEDDLVKLDALMATHPARTDESWQMWLDTRRRLSWTDRKIIGVKDDGSGGVEPIWGDDRA